MNSNLLCFCTGWQEEEDYVNLINSTFRLICIWVLFMPRGKALDKHFCSLISSVYDFTPRKKKCKQLDGIVSIIKIDLTLSRRRRRDEAKTIDSRQMRFTRALENWHFGNSFGIVSRQIIFSFARNLWLPCKKYFSAASIRLTQFTWHGFTHNDNNLLLSKLRPGERSIQRTVFFIVFTMHCFQLSTNFMPLHIHEDEVSGL